MASPSVVYAFTQNRVQRQLAFTRVTEALYTMLIDVQRQRAEPVSLTWGHRPLYDAAALQRVYARCRGELEATGGGVPPSLEAVARAEVLPAGREGSTG
jgi:hypothetical protein